MGVIAKSQAEYSAEVKSRWSGKVKVIGRYISSDKRVEHRCTECKESWERAPKQVLSMKNLPCCSRHQGRKLSHADYVSALEKIGSTLKPLEEYTSSRTKICHRCSVCKEEKDLYPMHVIKGTKCFVCQVNERSAIPFFRRKTLVLGGRIHTVQGFEDKALKALVNLGYNPKRLVTAAPDGKPTIRYSHDGRTRIYVPDIFYKPKNRIIEVKSIWTLGLDERSKDMFKKNIAKARSCIEQGYSFKLMLFTKDGRRLKLPKNWMNMKRTELRRVLL